MAYVFMVTMAELENERKRAGKKERERERKRERDLVAIEPNDNSLNNPPTPHLWFVPEFSRL